MKVSIITAAAKAIAAIGPSIKSWIFADGKFSMNRALVLIATLCVLLFGAWFIGPENLESVTDALEEVSDVIGYE